MNLSIDYYGNKGFRLLSIYERLNKGEIIEKAQLAEYFGVTQKSIQRDIDDLRAYIAEVHFTESEIAIKYDKVKKGYYLVRYEREWLTNEEVIALCKILLESRAFCKEELNNLISKLLTQVVPNDRKKIENIIINEQHYYVPLQHGKYLFSILWKLSQLITYNEFTQFTYTRQDGAVNERLVKPVAIMFSEYYFYLIAYIAEGNKDFPTVFRVDRITDLNGTKQYFNIPYKDKFNDGEFRKRVQFMYSGELRRVTFKYNGPSIEAVLDRLPTAEVLSDGDGKYTIRVEVYGNGIDMWLRSQGDKVEILTNSFKEKEC
ncbi:MAG: WYL domain-containing protein [Clostridiaceae bacterium]